jgi:hypothetical protein
MEQMFNRTNIENLTLEDIHLQNWQIFIFLIIIHLLIAFWANHIVFTRELYYALLSDQMELKRIDDFAEILERYSFLSTLLIPFLLFIEYLINTLLLQLPLLLNYIEIKFRQLFRIVMLSSVALLAGRIFHFACIYFSPLDKASREILTIKPFSLASLIQASAYPRSLLYVLNECNLFQLFWVGCIFFGLLKTNSMKNSDAALIAIVMWSMMLFLHWGIYFFCLELW